jgi:pimeloyl-ACP methyl ester carboxylesterase
MTLRSARTSRSRAALAALALLGAAAVASSCMTRRSPKKDAGGPVNTARQDGFVTTSDGVKIHYLVEGEGSPVVLVHGYYANADGNWWQNGVAPALVQHHRVIGIDCRGHGDSDKPHDPAQYGEHMYQDVLAVMDALGVQRAHVHGYSMGGSILAALLLHAPDRVITAAFGGSGVEEKGGVEVADEKGADPREATAKAELLKALPHDLEAMGALAKNWPWSDADNDEIDLTQLHLPVLALIGQYDTPEAKTRRMARELSDFKKVVFPGRSHLTTIMPGYIGPEYIAALTEFIDGHDK